MKIFIAGFTIVGTFCSTLAISLADENLPNYIYKPDGSYSDGSYQSVAPGTETSDGALPLAGGHTDITVGYVFDHDTDATAVVGGLRGSYGRRFRGDWHIQGDLRYDYIDYSSGGAYDELSGAVHLSKNVKPNLAVGGFVQGGFIGASGANQFSGGVEAATFLENATIYGRVGYSEVDLVVAQGSGVVGALGGRVYVNDQFRIDGELRAWENFGLASLTALYRLPNKSSSLYLNYTHVEGFDDTIGGGTGAVLAGWRVHFGGATLKEEERNGSIWSAVR